MGLFGFLKKKKSQDELKNAINEKVMDVLSKQYPEVLSGIVSMINSGDERELVALPDVEHSRGGSGGQSETTLGDKVTGSYEQAKQEAESLQEAVEGAKKSVEEDLSGEVAREIPSKSEIANSIKDGKGETKLMTEVILPDDKGTGEKVVFMTWDDQEATEYLEENKHSALKQTTHAVGVNPKDNLRAVLIGADPNVPEIRAYYEALQSLGKIIVLDKEASGLEKYDVFYFANQESGNELTDEQLSLSEKAKNLYVIYFDDKKFEKLPFKREYSVFVPFKGVEKYDSLRSRIDFLEDYTGVDFKDDKQVKNVKYINILSLMDNSYQKHMIQKVKNSGADIQAFTEYVYVNNYGENIIFPLSKVVKKRDITVYGQSSPEIHVNGVHIKNALSYYEAPAYMSNYESIMHFVTGGKAILKTADIALMTYAEAQIPMSIFSQNIPQMEEYLELIAPASESNILTKEELFERFGDGMHQLQEALK